MEYNLLLKHWYIKKVKFENEKKNLLFEMSECQVILRIIVKGRCPISLAIIFLIFLRESLTTVT